jgi:hypothetical protein
MFGPFALHESALAACLFRQMLRDFRFLSIEVGSVVIPQGAPRSTSGAFFETPVRADGLGGFVSSKMDSSDVCEGVA